MCSNERRERVRVMSEPRGRYRAARTSTEWVTVTKNVVRLGDKESSNRIVTKEAIGGTK